MGGLRHGDPDHADPDKAFSFFGIRHYACLTASACLKPERLTPPMRHLHGTPLKIQALCIHGSLRRGNKTA
jgi:hypothetical protein